MVLIFVMLVDIVSGVHYDSQYMLVMFVNMVLMLEITLHEVPMLVRAVKIAHMVVMLVMIVRFAARARLLIVVCCISMLPSRNLEGNAACLNLSICAFIFRIARIWSKLTRKTHTCESNDTGPALHVVQRERCIFGSFLGNGRWW